MKSPFDEDAAALEASASAVLGILHSELDKLIRAGRYVAVMGVVYCIEAHVERMIDTLPVGTPEDHAAARAEARRLRDVGRGAP